MEGPQPDRRADAELVADLVQGDELALAELYDRHADAVFRLAFRFLGDRSLAEEVLQETYLALWNRAELYDESLASLSAWLLAIARNRSVDRLRAIGRRPLTVTLSAIGTDEADDTAAERTIAAGQLVASGPVAGDPEAHLDARWLADTVRAVLADMPEPERRAIELAYYEDLTQVEIAERLGWPLGTVKTRTRRALARLRMLLSAALGPEIGRRVAPVPVAFGDRSPVAASEAGGHDGPR
jgi:RNA polymerase sigma-70 factor (ECF subfamily)